MKIRLFKDKRLKFAIVRNNLRMLSKLLEEGCSADIEIDGNSAVIYALEKGYFDIALKLIKANADISKTDEDFYSPLHYAFLNENTPIEVIKSLVIHGANVNAASTIGRTPLHMACINGNLPAMKYLISNGADLYRTDMFGNTLIHMACMNNHTDIINFLINNELNLYQGNNMGIRAVDLLETSDNQDLFYSVRFKDKKRMIQELGVTKKELSVPMRKDSLKNLEYDFTINNSTRGLSNILFIACKKRNVKYVRYLIDMGANVTSIDRFGNNVLMNMACKNNDVNMIRLLMENGVSIFENNYMRQAPVDLLAPKIREKLLSELATNTVDILIGNYPETPSYNKIPSSTDKDTINRLNTVLNDKISISTDKRTINEPKLISATSSPSINKRIIKRPKTISATNAPSIDKRIISGPKLISATSSPSIDKCPKLNKNPRIPNRSISMLNLNNKNTYSNNLGN